MNVSNFQFNAQEQTVSSNDFNRRIKELSTDTQPLRTFKALRLVQKDEHFKFSEPKENVRESLKNHELAEAIEIWLKDKKKTKKVGVLLMMNCWMMNMHTMYALKDRVHCLVAPQSGISSPGYNYRDILRYIYRKKKPLIPQNLAIKCVEYSENKFAKNRARKLNKGLPNTIDFWKIFAIDLQVHDGEDLLFDKQLEALKKFIRLLNCSTRKKRPKRPDGEIGRLCSYVRSVCKDFSGDEVSMIDMANWCQSINSADHNLNRKILPGYVLEASQAFFDLVNKSASNKSLFLKATEGKLVYARENDNKSLPLISLPPTGYSLFFPIQGFLEKGNLAANVQADDFLNKYLRIWKFFLSTHIDDRITFP